MACEENEIEPQEEEEEEEEKHKKVDKGKEKEEEERKNTKEDDKKEERDEKKQQKKEDKEKEKRAMFPGPKSRIYISDVSKVIQDVFQGIEIFIPSINQSIVYFPLNVNKSCSNESNDYLHK